MIGVLAGVLLATVSVELPAGTCTSSAAIAAAAEVHADRPLELRISPVETGFSVSFAAPGAPPMTRLVELEPRDCPILPQMLALMVERYLRALPRYTWARRAPPAPPTTALRSTTSRTPADRRPTLGFAGAAGAGATVGVNGAGAGLQVEAGLALSGETFGFGAGLGVRVVPRVDFGDGRELRVTAPTLVLTGQARTELGPVAPWLRAGVSAGVAIGEARGFEGASTDAAALVEPLIQLGADVGDGLSLGLEARFRAVGPRFSGPSEGIDYAAPAVRLGAFVGLRRTIAFF